MGRGRAPTYGGASTKGIGPLAEKQGLQNLYQMLLTQGNIDPRIMQSMQAANSRATQQAMDAQRARASRGGFSRGGLNNALMNSIGSQGANRAAGITYQNAADAYGRNQQNVGLMSQLVQQPNLGYANLNESARIGQLNQNNLRDAAAMAFVGNIIGGAGAAGGGCWVAEAIFGPGVETELARLYVNVLGPAELKAAYLADGEELAEAVRANPVFASELRPTFLRFAQTSASALWG